MEIATKQLATLLLPLAGASVLSLAAGEHRAAPVTAATEGEAKIVSAAKAEEKPVFANFILREKAVPVSAKPSVAPAVPVVRPRIAGLVPEAPAKDYVPLIEQPAPEASKSAEEPLKPAEVKSEIHLGREKIKVYDGLDAMNARELLELRRQSRKKN